MNSSRPEILLVPFTDLPFQMIDQLLAREAQDWSSVLRWQFNPVKDAFMAMFSAGILPGIAVVRRGECLGYVYHLQRDHRCTIGGLYFSPELHISQWPRLTLEQTLDTIGSRIPVETIEGQLTFPGAEASLEPLLKERGFFFIRRSFMRCDPLVANEEMPLIPNLSLSGIEWGQIDSLALLMSLSYSKHADNQVSSLYRNFSGCRFLLEQLILRNGCGCLQPWCSLTAYINREPVGAVLVSSIAEQSYFISQCFVHPRFQKSGIGQYLLQTCKNRIVAKDPGSSLALTVTVSNRPAYKWYKKNGFREIIPHFSFLHTATFR